MFKFLYIAIIVLLIAAIAIAGWKFKGKRNSHKVKKDNSAWETALTNIGAYKEKQIVFFGDSEISLWPMQSFFGVLPIKNRGLSGDLVTHSLERYKEEVSRLRPETVVLLIGTNDLGKGVRPSEILKGIKALIEEGKQTDTKIIVCGLLPVSSEIADAGRPVQSLLMINESLSEICQKEGLEFVDFYNALIDKEGFFDKQYSDDGLHPNEQGYLIMSGIILPHILKIL